MRHSKHTIFWVLTVLFLNIGFSGAAQYAIPKKPILQTSVYDDINLLDAAQKNNLEQKLIRYSDSTSTQIVIAIIASTEGEYINYLGAQWAEKWDIGQAKEDNGVFILLAKNDRKIGVNTGKGIEHLLTDAMSKRIIERDIIPYFKENDYFGGLNRGTDAIFEVLKGEYKAARKNNSEGFPLGVFIFLFIIFIIFLIAFSKGGGKGGNHRRHNSNARGLLEAIILSNMGRGGYSGKSSSGGFGGGGFSGGFGGGSFGGGGASGGW